MANQAQINAQADGTRAHGTKFPRAQNFAREQNERAKNNKEREKIKKVESEGEKNAIRNKNVISQII